MRTVSHAIAATAIRPTPIALALLLLYALCGAALAHTPSESTHPADGATLDAVPETLRVTFAAPIRIVKLVLTHADADGTHETRLDPPSRQPIDTLRLAPALPGSGRYDLAWRALGADGHVVSGSFTFHVR